MTEQPDLFRLTLTLTLAAALAAAVLLYPVVAESAATDYPKGIS